MSEPVNFKADVGLLLEGTFPYVSGGVSSWINQIIRAYPEYRYAIVFLGSRREDYSGFKYELPANVVHFEEHYLHEQAPWLEVDGEMHGDVALDGEARRALMPHSTLQGDANLLVLPNIDAANIAYNLLKTAAGGGIAIGPVLLGAAKPVHVLTPSATVRRIVNMTALTVADANAAR